MRYFLAVYVLALVAVASLAGFRGGRSPDPPLEIFPDMDRQLKLRPQAGSGFFGNGRSSQPQVEGTVARGAPWEDIPLHTGMEPGTTNFVEAIPVPVDLPLLERGRERYAIHCAPCHGALGDGRGVATRYGMVAVASFHDPRLVGMPPGEIFHTITHGKNLMGPYGPDIGIRDRWAIAAYLRALQRAALALEEEVPEEARDSFLRALEEQEDAADPAGEQP